jgi:3-isopropylmalate dehydrogenase
MATFPILLTPGDGIGPEVLAEATKVLARIEKRFKHEFVYEEETIGGAAIDATAALALRRSASEEAAGGPAGWAG